MRSALAICEDILKHDLRIMSLKVELEDVTGMPYDKFMAGMRRLLAPAPDPS